MTDLLAHKLSKLPSLPGVYIMKDDLDRIIYVGKAIILKNRVRQYFQSSSNHSPKVRAMVAKVVDFDTIITANEVESLILEANLIKKHRPRYNIRLKDDKSYPYVKITLADDFPRAVITRKMTKDGSRYFGPYTNVKALKDSLKLLRKLFPLRTCRKLPERPCLEYHIKRCLAPCIGQVTKDDYRYMINAVELFLEGSSDEVERELEKRMTLAAEAYQFEAAARIRDQLASIRKATEKQKIVSGSGNQDAIGMARSGSSSSVCMEIFFIRQGKMIGREHFILKGTDEESDEALVTAFLEQYYNRATFIPSEILLPIELTADSKELLSEWLSAERNIKSERRGNNFSVSLITPKRGAKRDIVLMANENAKKYLADEESREELEDAKTIGAVKELGRYLGLAKMPYRMECFDISHMQGSETVASMVVFEGGQTKKSDYRRFKIKSAEGKPDDFLSMREVTSRRYVGLAEKELPDLIIIDGGKGQLSSALEIIRNVAGHSKVPVVGLAKQYELIFVEGKAEPIELPRNSQALYLVQRIRDEAHRFAITYHRKLRGKRNLVSVLDHIVGIGAKRREALWTHFGSLDKIKAATLEELVIVKGMTKASAEAVYNFFATQKEFRQELTS